MPGFSKLMNLYNANLQAHTRVITAKQSFQEIFSLGNIAKKGESDLDHLPVLPWLLAH